MAVNNSGGYSTLGLQIATGAQLNGNMLTNVDTLAPNGANPQSVAAPLGLLSAFVQSATGITAFAGGGQANATLLDYGFSNVAVVATAADSVKLPAAVLGAKVTVMNSSANSMQVFGQAGTSDTINAAATATGVAHAAGKMLDYVCTRASSPGVPGLWVRGS